MKPPVNLMQWKPGRYINAASTDLAKTFARVRKEMAQQEKAQSNVEPLALATIFKKRA